MFLTEFGDRKNSREALKDSHARRYWIWIYMTPECKRICESNRPENGEGFWQAGKRMSEGDCSEGCSRYC